MTIEFENWVTLFVQSGLALSIYLFVGLTGEYECVYVMSMFFCQGTQQCVVCVKDVHL